MAVADATERYFAPLRDEAISGQIIARDETDTVVGKLEVLEGKRGVLLVGPAGCGKSPAALQIVSALRTHGWLVKINLVCKAGPVLFLTWCTK